MYDGTQCAADKQENRSNNTHPGATCDQQSHFWREKERKSSTQEVFGA
jgi:hypothetical protein